ncbi:hypothetical protein CKO28_18825 [Rhodovibrio sodomensis]|uniref:Uncharacterized protein n=1 Tax=Rhodovibrio sodomensis TaxID=1088 RepID=A0ABS1DIH8_9PROT|nr:hypothetical protein [Rhodovibrio sodomensis]MBK1670093.1 hypothetical protein [Rhodovibrio sodomensis]
MATSDQISEIETSEAVLREKLERLVERCDAVADASARACDDSGIADVEDIRERASKAAAVLGGASIEPTP